MEIPYFKALTSTQWSHVQEPYTLIQAKEWNNNLTLLSDLLQFLREDKKSYCLPQDWKRTFSLIRLADMLDTFIQTVARETRIPVPLLNNSNPIKSVRLRLWAVYQLAKYLKDKVHTGTCGLCSLPLCDIPPRRAEVVYVPYCSVTVHTRCWKDPTICSTYSTGLLPLPCVICKAPIECWGGDIQEESCQLESEELSAIQRAVAEGLPLATDQQYTCRFTHIRMNDITLHGLSWHESQRWHNCTVKFSGHSSQSHYFGQIEHFAKVRDDSGASRLCAFITLLQCSTPFSSLPLPTKGFYAMERTTTSVVIEAIGLVAERLSLIVQCSSRI